MSVNHESTFEVVEENARAYINNVWVDYLQLPDRELKVLLALKSYAWNNKTECYPSIPSLAERTGKKTRQVSEILQCLKLKGLIRIETRLGKSCVYYITNISLTDQPNQKLSTDSPLMRKSVNEPLRESAGHHCGSSQDTPAGIRRRSSIKEYKKEVEREHSLPVDNFKSENQKPQQSKSFSPNNSHHHFCQSHQLDINKELESFHHKHRGEKTDYEFTRWLNIAHEYKERNVTRQKYHSTEEIRSTVLEWGPGHPSWEANREWERKRAGSQQ